MKRFTFLIGTLTFFSAPVVYGQDAEPAATEVEANLARIRFYKLAVSTSSDCSNPITVLTNNDGLLVDLIANPTFGKGKIPAGTYNCVMIEVAKIIETSAAVPTLCNPVRQSAMCSDTHESQSIGSTNPDILCSGGVGTPQRVTYYFSTQANPTDGPTQQATTYYRAALKPINGTDNTYGFRLAQPLVYPSKKKAKLQIKKVMIANNTCDPTVRFTIQFE
jgi:hypothetical protein